MSSHAVLFSVAADIDENEEFTLYVYACVMHERVAYVLEGTNIAHHHLTTDRKGNSAVSATLKPCDVHRVNFARFSKTVRSWNEELGAFSFLVMIKKGESEIYKKIYPEYSVDEDYFLVDVVCTDDGEYKIQEGEIIIKVERS